MSLHLSFSVDCVIDTTTQAKLRKWATIDIDGRGICIIEIDSICWREPIQLLKTAGHSIHANRLRFLDETKYRWSAPDTSWIGAVVTPFGGGACENPESDLLEPFSIDYREVRSNISVTTAVAPSDHFDDYQGNWVISRKFALALGISVQGAPQLFVRGKRLPEFVRCEIADSCSVLSAADCYKDARPCSRCGLAARSPVGVWIANTDDEYFGVTTRDEAGFAHLNRERPLIVSLDRALEISRSVRGGYHLKPIFAPTSPRAQFIRAVIAECADAQ